MNIENLYPDYISGKTLSEKERAVLQALGVGATSYDERFKSTPRLVADAQNYSQSYNENPRKRKFYLHYAPKQRVTLFLDRSGSMGVAKMTAAKKCVSSFFKWLESNAVDHQCIAFPSYWSNSLGILSPYGERLKTFEPRLAEVGAFGMTPFKDVLTYINALMEPGELAIILTDGCISASQCMFYERHVRKSGVKIGVLAIDGADSWTNLGIPVRECTDNESYVEMISALEEVVNACLQ